MLEESQQKDISSDICCSYFCCCKCCHARSEKDELWVGDGETALISTRMALILWKAARGHWEYSHCLVAGIRLRCQNSGIRLERYFSWVSQQPPDLSRL